MILKHEETAAPPGWLCHWSDDFKMYYYHNSNSGESQWEYPTLDQSALLPNDVQQMSFQPMITPIVPPYIDPHHIVTAPSINHSLVSPAHGFSRDPVPNVVTKKRPAAPTEKSTLDPYRDPYRATSKRKKDDISTDDTSLLSGTDSGTSSPLPRVIAAAPMIRTRESSPAVIATPPLPIEDYRLTYSPQPPSTTDEASSSKSTSKPKLKKKKKLDASGLPSKKSKQVSSLVQKWQTVKQQEEDEKNIELESDDETHEEASERRIEEWKKEMEDSSKKEWNPNFTEIKGDWRARLKRKT